MKKLMKKLNNKGFNLVELLAAIVILAMVTGIALVSYNSYYEKARDRVFQNYEDAMKEAAMTYIMDTGKMPTSSRALKLELNFLLGGKDSSGVQAPRSYIDPFKNPRNNDDKCNTASSYVQVKRKAKTATTDGRVDNNKSFEYKVCLVCGSYYKTSGC